MRSRNQHMEGSYANNSSIPEIQESIGEESMNFYNSNEQAISEMISVSKSKNNNYSMSREAAGFHKSKANVSVKHEANNQPINEEEASQSVVSEYGKENSGLQNPANKTEAVFLGDNVVTCIKERYTELNKIQTNDADVLFDFYKLQRKSYKPSKSTNKNITLENIAGLMPSAQRKVLVKAEFEKILTYYPDDVYYTLLCGAEKLKKDEKLQNKMNLLNTNQFVAKTVKKVNQEALQKLSAPKNINGEHLEKHKKSEEEIKREERNRFGARLRQVYENNFRSNPQPPLESYEKMCQFWEDTYERDEYKIEWNEDTFRDDLRTFMYEQIETLQRYLTKKIGIKQFKGKDLYKFYMKYRPIEGVYMSPASFNEYVKVFNDVQNGLKKQEEENMRKHQEEYLKKRKASEAKKFGHPVSSTPISVLSRPKSAHNVNDLAEKYSKDKLLQTILHTDKMKFARHPWEYGIHNLEEEIKVKGRVKPNSKELYDKTIFKMLQKTFGGNSSDMLGPGDSMAMSAVRNFSDQKNHDRIRDILGEENLQKDENWSSLGPVLQEAMLVKCYETKWFRDALLKFCKKTVDRQDLQLEDDKVVVREIIKYFNHLPEDDRGDELGNFDNVISTSETIADRTEQINSLSKKGPTFQKGQKRLFEAELQDKARQFLEMRLKKKQVNIRKFMNDLFEAALKKHPQYVKKHFNVIKGDKECPQLLKYEFFRLQKQLNPFTKERDEKAKCHAWIPTKSTPNEFNCKTYNTYANFYVKDKSKIVAQPEKQKNRDSLWGRNKGKDRQRVLMSYSDAKQCIFHPKISKSII